MYCQDNWKTPFRVTTPWIDLRGQIGAMLLQALWVGAAFEKAE